MVTSLEFLVHCSSVQHAVIQTPSQEDGPEQAVMTTRIRSISQLLQVSSGPASHCATKRSRTSKHVPDTRHFETRPRITPMFRATHGNGDSPGGLGLATHCRIPQSILQSALGAVIALFYSENIVSIMIRMALGAF